MKKQTRIPRTKLIERAKTAVIVLLSLSCLYLGVRVLEIYRSQADFDDYWQGVPFTASDTEDNSSEFKNALNCFEMLSAPELIVANSDSGRKAVEDRDKSIGALAVSVVRDIYESSDGDAVSAVTEAEARLALKANSFYVKFASERSTSYEAAFYNVKSSLFQRLIKSYRDIIIMPYADQTGVTVFARDTESKTWVKALSAGENARKLAALIKNTAAAEARDLVFAYELNLDKSTDGGASLDSMLLIPVVEVQPHTVVLNVPRTYKAGLSFARPTEFSIGLANIFRYNPNTIRQYVTSDGALMFVGETGNLSVHPDGLIEYKALDASDGIVVSASAQNGVQEALSGVYGIVEQIRRLSEIQRSEGCEIRITRMPESDASLKRYELGFDYYINGIKIDFENSFGVQAVVENGAVVEFKMYVKTVDAEQHTAQVEKMFDAIDRYCTENPDYTAISDAKAVYRFAGNEKETAAEWKIKGER